MQVPDWMKSGVFIIMAMIIWDLIRIPLQAWITKLFMSNNFRKIEDSVEEIENTVEEALEEENEHSNKNNRKN